ncbi:MAG: glutamine amidotransferase [Hyphomonadaceae bacterium]
MKITILEVGRPPGRLEGVFPSYPEMFSALLSRSTPGLAFDTVSLVDGAALPEPSGVEAILITGSPLGVYDSAPWMDPLRAHIRAAAATGTPMAGVCFGHQIMADAMGGTVRKSPKGWGVGRHTYDILSRPAFMNDAGERFSLAVSHQDQVIEPPAGAQTLASSTHTSHAMLAYQDAPFISFQGHPEFSDTFAAALYNARRDTLGDDVADAAVESLSEAEDNDLVADWIVRFLQTARR